MVEQPPLVTVYLISAEPADTPLTKPLEFTFAMPVALLDHTPPAVVEAYVVVEPTQTDVAPVMAATVGAALTRIDLVAVLTFPALYAFKVMVYVPAILKVDVTVVAVDVDGIPPGIVHRTESTAPEVVVEVLENVRLLPAQTVVSLEVKEAEGVGLVDVTPYKFTLST